MSANLPHAPGEHGEPPAKSPGRGPGRYAYRAVKALASLQLTVALLAVGIGLVFFGTLAQIDFGIWTVVDKYFASWVVDVPFDLFRKLLNVFWKEAVPPGGSAWSGSFPFPAGYAVGVAMMLNLLAAHALRFKLTWKRAGVFLIHGGLILLLVGEFVTRQFAVEQQMRIDQGAAADFTIDTRNVELAFVDTSDPALDRVATVSQKRLKAARAGERVAHNDLPVDVEVLKFMKNSDFLDVAPFEPESGKTARPALVPSEQGTGPAAYIRLHDKGTKQPLGVFAVGPQVKEQRFDAGKISVRLSWKDDGLRLVDASPAAFDRVAQISRGGLRSAATGQRIAPEALSLEVEVVQYMPKAELVDVTDFGKGKVTGNLTVVEVGEESGVATKSRGDASAAYVRLYKKGTADALGVYVLGVYNLLQDQPVKTEGGERLVSLRNARIQKPYRIHLDKFSFDRYEGTQKPKNYSSEVRVYAADAAPDGPPARTTTIRMNEPLRYAGETFYQADFDKDTEKTTILQVVKNPGTVNFGLFYATIDYIACALVGFGLLLHFGIYLTQFLMRQGKAPAGAAAGPGAAAVPAAPPSASRIFPWVMLGLAVLALMAGYGRMTPRATREPYDLDAFARLPVIEGGRVKPLETVARVYLRTVSHREFFEDDSGKAQPAVRWYLDVMTAGDIKDDSPAWQHRVFRIENPEVRDELKLPLREGLRYSLAEIRPRIRALMEKTAEAQQKAKQKKQLSIFESKMIELEERMSMVLSLHRLRGLNAQGVDTLRLLPPEAGATGWQSLGDAIDRARRESEMGAVAAADKLVRADNFKRLYESTDAQQRQLVRIVTGEDLDRLKDEDKQAALLDVVKTMRMTPEQLGQMPPQAQARAQWLAAAYVLLPGADASRIQAESEAEYRTRLAAVPAAGDWEKMRTTYRDRKPTEFNAAVAEYRANRLGAVSLADTARTRVEVTYNRFAPFYQCAGLYVFAFLLAVFGFAMYAAERPRWAAALRRSAFLVLFVTLVVHTLALLARMHIMDRYGVFVTNLYSSAIFIGWGCVALGLILERIFPIGVGNIIAAVLGLTTTIVAHNLGTQDTLEMMEAVLDTNFWLATHVTTVTLGYTATFVAGFLAAVYVLMMLGTVVRDSYESKGEPTVGALLAFGTAVLGLVGIPVAFAWFAKSALEKFEVVHPLILDAGFWLAAAVGTVYGLTLLLLRVSAAGADAQGRPLQGQIPPLARPAAALALTPESGRIVGQMIYGVIAFATMLSFIGTVLGGIWADQSWGRFWGWDPKENGAVLIVLWNALILHARWCGLVKDRGVAVLAVFGNVITGWSWFGTNQLGIGLHAYGFDSRLADGCFNFWVLQLAILAVGAAIPRHFWASATRRAAGAAPAGRVAEASANLPAVPTDAAAPAANGHDDGAPNDSGPARRDRGKRPKRR
ncbi:MAG: cytochrome c biogenesis protein ResB [Gemmata sp.]